MFEQYCLNTGEKIPFDPSQVDEWISKPDVKTVISMGFSIDLVKQVIKHKLKTTGMKPHAIVCIHTHTHSSIFKTRVSNRMLFDNCNFDYSSLFTESKHLVVSYDPFSG